MLYMEGPRTAFVDGEMLVGEFDYVIYTSSLHWLGANEAMSQTDSQRVLKNIREAFQQEGIKLEVV